MATVNLNNIQKKIKLPKAGSRKSKSKRDAISISLNGDDVKKAIEVAEYNLRIAFHVAINNDGFNNGAKAAIGDITFGEPEEDTEIEGRYIVYGNIDKNSRDSLVPKQYPDGAEDMAALMNNGYTAGNRVFGVWHDKKIGSLIHRDGHHFVQQAIDDFNNGYGSEVAATAELINERVVDNGVSDGGRFDA